MKFPQCAALPLKHILDLANWDQKYIVLEQSPFVIVNLMNDSVRSKKKRWLKEGFLILRQDTCADSSSQCGNYGNLLSHFFERKFRESNIFTKEGTKVLISRNIFSMRVNFSFFHTVFHFLLLTNTSHSHTVTVEKQPQNLCILLSKR